jgi:hypothetical protein
MPSAALARHPAAPCAALAAIRVSVLRNEKELKVAYVLEGEIARLRIPSPRPPRFAERLWERTCCEIFLARADQPGYRELNLSPSGEWAAYLFQDYRRGRMDERSPAPEILVERDLRRLELAASIPMEDKGKLRIGLSAVIEDDSGRLSYWALRHAPGKPDFHHPDAFALELDAVRH